MALVDQLLQLKRLGLPLNSLQQWAKEEKLPSTQAVKPELFFRRVSAEIDKKKQELAAIERTHQAALARWDEEKEMLKHQKCAGLRPEKDFLCREIATATTMEDLPDDVEVQLALTQLRADLLKASWPIGADWGVLVETTPAPKQWKIGVFMEEVTDANVTSLTQPSGVYRKRYPSHRFSAELIKDDQPLKTLLPKLLKSSDGQTLLAHVCSQLTNETPDPFWQMEVMLEDAPSEAVHQLTFLENLRCTEARQTIEKRSRKLPVPSLQQPWRFLCRPLTSAPVETFPKSSTLRKHLDVFFRELQEAKLPIGVDRGWRLCWLPRQQQWEIALFVEILPVEDKASLRLPLKCSVYSCPSIVTLSQRIDPDNFRQSFADFLGDFAHGVPCVILMHIDLSSGEELASAPWVLEYVAVDEE